MSVSAARSVVFVGRVDQQNLLVVTRPNGSATNLVAYYGPEGSLQPQEVAGSGSWTISQGTLKNQRNGHIWTAKGVRGTMPVYARDPGHFIISGNPGEQLHVISQMRHFVYAGTNGITHVAVTAVGGDMGSVEFYMNYPGRSDEMVRRTVSDVTVNRRDRRAFHVELPPATLFSYMEVGQYRRNLPKKTALPPDLPKSGYVGVMDGCLRPIGVSTLLINQKEGRVRTT